MNFADLYRVDAQAEARKIHLVERARELLRSLKRLMISRNVDARWAKLTVRVAVKDLEDELALDPQYIEELINDLYRAIRALERDLAADQQKVVLETTALLQAVLLQRIKERAASRCVYEERRHIALPRSHPSTEMQI